MVLKDHKAYRIDLTFNNALVNEQTIVFTDNSTSYDNITDYVKLDIRKKSDK